MGTASETVREAGAIRAAQPGWGRRELVIAAALFALAAALRVAYVMSVADDPSVQYPMVDSRAYHERAIAIVSGEWISDRVAYQDPLYPYFLAMLYALFGVGSIGVLVAQALLDAGTVVLVYDLGRRLFGSRCGVAAGLLAALYEVFFFYDAFLLKVPLSVFLVTGALVLSVRADLSGRAGAWLFAGLALAFACLTRGNYLLFVPIAAGFALNADGRIQLARTAAYAAGIVAVFLPVATYNYGVANDFVLVTSQAGQNFYTGNHRGNATGGYLAPPFVRANPAYEEVDFAEEARRRTGTTMKPSELSRYWFGQAFEEILADPGHFARHLQRKARIYFGAYEVPDNQSYDYFATEVSPLLSLPFPTYGAILPLALCGMVLGARQRSAWLPIGFFVTYSLSVIVFFNMSRYRIPIVPALAVFAGLALVRAVGWLARREVRPLCAMGLFLALAYPLVYSDVVRPDFAVTHYNLGIRHLGTAELQRRQIADLEARGDAEGVRAAREEALVFMELARRDLRRSLELRPDETERGRGLARLMVTIALEREALGDTAAALEQAREAAATFPRSADAHAHRGRLEALYGDEAWARGALERALALSPDHPVAKAALETLDGEANDSREAPPTDG